MIEVKQIHRIVLFTQSVWDTSILGLYIFHYD